MQEVAMPIYEYLCADCKKPFEIVRPIKDSERKNVKCPKCESRKVERRFTSVFVETSRKN
jgi:putative FmdB family regulatory protein